MDHKKTDTRRIAEEAVGERPEGTIPDAAKEQSKAVPDEAAIRQAATSVGSQASVAAKTAEAVGERHSGAYAYADATADEVQKRSRVSRPTARQAESQYGRQPFVWVVAAFALGYAAASLTRRRG